MRKITVFVVLLALLVSSFPVHAQDEGNDYPACTEEEMNFILDTLESYYQDIFEEHLVNHDLATSDPSDMAYGESLVLANIVSTGYLGRPNFLPKCIEAQTMGYLDGGTYDLYLTIGLLFNLASWTSDPLPDTSAALFESAQTRLDIFNQSLESAEESTRADAAATLSSMGLESSCTSDQMSTLVESVNDSLSDLIAALETREDDPMSTFLQTEAISFAYNDETFGMNFTCAENYWVAWKAGALFTDANIVAGLYANAAYEEDGGNTWVADQLTESANDRIDKLITSTEELSEELIALGELASR